MSRVLPPSSLCQLSSARWGVCWGKSSFSWSSRKICAALESVVALSEPKLLACVLSAGGQEASGRACFLGGLLAVPGVWRPTCKAISLGSARSPSVSQDGAWGLFPGRVGTLCLGGVCTESPARHSQAPPVLTCPLLSADVGLLGALSVGLLTLYETPRRPVLDQGAPGILSLRC